MKDDVAIGANRNQILDWAHGIIMPVFAHRDNMANLDDAMGFWAIRILKIEPADRAFESIEPNAFFTVFFCSARIEVAVTCVEDVKGLETDHKARKKEGNEIRATIPFLEKGTV